MYVQHLTHHTQVRRSQVDSYFELRPCIFTTGLVFDAFGAARFAQLLFCTSLVVLLYVRLLLLNLLIFYFFCGFFAFFAAVAAALFFLFIYFFAIA